MLLAKATALAAKVDMLTLDDVIDDSVEYSEGPPMEIYNGDEKLRLLIDDSPKPSGLNDEILSSRL